MAKNHEFATTGRFTERAEIPIAENHELTTVGYFTGKA
jgi:hypothetical protein